MKMRIRGNSIRLRLLRSEVAALVDAGKVSEQINFGNAPLTYTVVSSTEAENISAKFAGSEITVFLPRNLVKDWADSADLSLEAEQKLDGNKRLKILVEKDLVCVTRKDDPDNRDAFPDPA